MGFDMLGEAFSPWAEVLLTWMERCGGDAAEVTI